VRHDGPSGRSSQKPSQAEPRPFRTDHRATLRPQSRPRRSPTAWLRRLGQPSWGVPERPPRSPISLHRPSRDPVPRRSGATSGQTPTIRRASPRRHPEMSANGGPYCTADPMGRHDVRGEPGHHDHSRRI
jgi:hypothetical protein